MCKIIRRSLSIILVLALVFQLLPLSCFAADAVDSEEMIGDVTLPEAEESPSVTETETEEEGEEEEPPQIVEEDLSKRDEYYKEFILDNGQRLATIYPTAVHYQKDNQWEEIDNTLIAALSDSASVYTNTAGPWSVRFPQQLSGSNAISITKDGYTVSFTMSGELTSGSGLAVASIDATATAELSVATAKTAMAQLQSVDTTALKASVQFPETVPDKLHGRLLYPSVYDNTNIVYDLDGIRLKESIILQSYDSTLYGYRYTLNTGGLVPTLNADQSISLCDPKTGDTVLSMPAPFLVDDSGGYSYDVQVSLVQKGTGYLLSYYLPQTWLAAEERAWPVVLDPIITAPTYWSIEDIAVASNHDISSTASLLECGYSPTWGVMRSFLRYTNLPTMYSSDVIVNATMQMTVQGGTVEEHTTIGVHKINSSWNASNVSWNNQPTISEIVEDQTIVKNQSSTNVFTWDITDIVRDWYANSDIPITSNTGMAFKAIDSIETGTTNNWKQLYSGDSTTNKPVLTIQFQRANGLEDYWDYTSSSAGRAGVGYVHNFSGNLVWVHEDMGFDGNRMPVSIQHIYNSSEAKPGNNFYNMGIGWKTNYHQTVSTTDASASWIDGDGTTHEFIYKATEDAYFDTDGLNLTLQKNSDETYTITDCYGNTSYFDTAGRLTKIENNQATKSSIKITYSGTTSQISQIIDGAGRVYKFVYTDDAPILLSRIEYYGTGTTVLYDVDYGYVSSKLTTITYKDGESSKFTYTNNQLTRVTNIDDYQIRYSYNTFLTGKPNQIKTIYEYDGVSYGNQLTLEYYYAQTKITDHDGHYQCFQFNKWGNTLAIYDDEGHGYFWDYWHDIRNRIKSESQEQNTVTNLFHDISFERGTPWSTQDGTNSSAIVVTDVQNAYRGKNCMKVSNTNVTSSCGAYSDYFTIPAGKTVCFSAYVNCTSGAIKLEIVENIAYQSEQTANATTGLMRLEVTYSNTSTQSKQIRARIHTTLPNSVAYIDCVQLEYSESASRFNLLENGDFKYSSVEDACWTLGDSATFNHSSSHPVLDSGQLLISGNSSSSQYAEQTVNVSGKNGDEIIIAGWALGDSMHIYDGIYNYCITVRFFKDGESVNNTTYILNFNENNASSVWQYNAREITAPSTFDAITVRIDCFQNANTVLFDGIQLYVERIGTTYTYDSAGNVTRSRDILDMATTYDYALNKVDLLSVIPPVGPKSEYIYDSYHNVTQSSEVIIDSEDNEETKTTTTYIYDTYGNLTSSTITNGAESQTTSTEYSSNGDQIVSTTNTEGKETTYYYNADTGLLEWIQEPKDTTTTRTKYEYDSMYRVSRVTEGLVTSTSTEMQVMYTYTDDELTEIQNNFQSYYLTHDNFGQLTSVSVGSQPLASYEYSTDKDHLLISLDYGNHFGIEYTYDYNDRLTVKTYTSNDGETIDGTVTYTYNTYGDIVSTKDSISGITTKYEYDDLGRLTYYSEIGDSRQYHGISYYYDDKGNLSKRKETIGTESRISEYTYDDLNRTRSSSTDAVETWYTYDTFDRESNRYSTYGNTVLHSNTIYRPSSNQVSQIQNYSQDENQNTNYSTTYTYTYDDNGNIKTVSDGTYTTTYTYDKANQLVREDNEKAGKSWYWTYNTAGNTWVTKEFAYTTGALGTPTKTITNFYDAYASVWKDRIWTRDGVQFTYDEIGNTLYDGEWNYTWERGRQLQSMTNGTKTWTMTYDADGLRTSRTDGTNTYYYYYHEGLLTYMKFNSLVMRFTYDAQGRPVSMTYNGNTYYYALNLQGDVMALLDANGNEVVSYHYNAWGEIISTTASTTAMLNTLAKYNPLRYRGYVYDRETGLYYLQSRYYNPEICRFINADNISNLGADGSVLSYNLYSYCCNNPVMGFDPSGCWNWGGFWAGVGIAAAGLAIIGLTVVTAGAATPLAAAAISAVGTGVGVAAVETGVAVTAAAATDSVAVLDVSCTDGSTSQKYGYSIVFDFGSNTGEVYSHYGTATSSSYSCSYGAGVVYNYNNPGDYGGSFIDVSASITKGGIDFGIDGCWDPSLKGTSAIMGTVGISLPPLRISPPITAGYDYYIPCCTFGW